MNLKERVEQHVIFVVIGVSVPVGAVVFAVSQYFSAERIDRLEHSHSQAVTELETQQSQVVNRLQLEHARAIAQLESRLASIERGMPDQKYYDIRHLMYSSMAEAEVPPDSKYFDDDKFYAPTNIEYWQYQKTTESDLLKSIFGEEPPRPLADVGRLVPIHLWRSTNQYTVELDGETWDSFPSIVLQKVPYEMIPKMINVGAAFARWLDEEEDVEFNEEDLAGSDDIDEVVQRLSSLVRDDMTGVFFHFQHAFGIQEALLDASNTRYRLIKVQKIGNVLYSQSLTEYRNARVNGEKQNVFYERTELILVAARKDLYLIKFTVPSREPLPRGEVYAHVNGWLSKMRVVID